MTKYRKSKTPTVESIYAIDYSRRLELFEKACKVFAIPMVVSSDIDILVVCGDERPHEKTS